VCIRCVRLPAAMLVEPATTITLVKGELGKPVEKALGSTEVTLRQLIG
jgi:hypothetical protein